MKHLLLTTALVAASATGAFAQEATTSTEAQAQTEATTPFFSESAATQINASDFIGMRVYASEAGFDGDSVEGASDDWEDIGEINDVILSREGNVEAVLVDIGGFLGIGERQVAVDMDEVKFVSDSSTADAENDFFLVLTADRATLEGAPEYGADAEMEQSAEAAAESTENAMEETADAAEATADEAGEELEQAADATENAAEEAGEEIQQETAEAGQAMENAADEVKQETADAAEAVEETADEAATETAEAVEEAGDEVQQETAEATDTEVTPNAEAEATATADASSDTATEEESTDMAASDEAAPAEEESTDMAATEETAPAADGSTDMAASDTEAMPAEEGATNSREGYATAAADVLTTETLTGARVYDKNDKWIGEISELLVDDGGQITDAIVDVGGFLGLGEKPVALQLTDLEILQESEGDDIRVYTAMAEEELEAMPEFEKE
ncbi:PRC-barrel domain-containing protein [Oceanicola sp. 22II-s10i]|uniref:PRC-barrel domain-containing protein n=1 Tax=Oceanicola sp. 22II-s10i TaxID=1317116 RepID=UPI0011302714|nr:PRC-barrel domain-containing protein [Oceanicola sp. 22II-s10i]